MTATPEARPHTTRTPGAEPARDPLRQGPTGDNPERPVLLDLMSVGIYVNSLGELHRSPALRSRAARVLHRHLHAEHPIEVRAALVAVLEAA